ncbi:MAG: hypothetical protein WBA25_10900 [Jannaschia sp.]
MTNDPNNFRDPKVTSTADSSSGGFGKWAAIAVGVLLLLLLLAWLLGLFAADDVETTTVPADETTTVPADEGTVVITE